MSHNEEGGVRTSRCLFGAIVNKDVLTKLLGTNSLTVKVESVNGATQFNLGVFYFNLLWLTSLLPLGVGG